MKRPAPPRPPLDRELADLPDALRRREWCQRIEVVIFASPEPVSREVLAGLIGAGARLEQLIAEVRDALRDRPYDLVAVAGGWMMHTRPAYADVIAAAAPAAVAGPELGQEEMIVLMTIAMHQPVTRTQLENMLRPDLKVPKELIQRLRAADLIGPGPRAPVPGAPYTYVTTDGFLRTYGLTSIRDLPDRERLEADGLLSTRDVLAGVMSEEVVS